MMLDGRQLAIFLMVLVALIQGVYGIQITASGGGIGESGSVAMSFDTLKTTSVSSQIVINGATVTPLAAIAGPITKFEQTHSVKDASGKYAGVYVKVLNAPNGLTYSSKVLPSQGTLTTIQPQVSAEQWLTVPEADSIKCTATSSYGSRSASVGLEEYQTLVAGDYVTLTGYYGKALTTGTLVSASQTAIIGEANSIKIYGSAKDSSGTSRVDTSLKGLSGGRATFVRLSETSSAGTTTQVTQKEHVHGTFTSTATFTPTTGAPKTTTRNSNYGTEYDLFTRTIKGSPPIGIVGFYVNPTTNANKIQGAVNAAQSGDTINVAAGTYKENVKIDKSLTMKGAGSTKTIVDGNKAGSVFTLGKGNPNAKVTLSDLKIQNGASEKFGGGIYNNGILTVVGSIITKNTAMIAGGGIANFGTLNVQGASIISGNTAGSSIGDGFGGGMCNWGKATITTSTITGNNAWDSVGGIGKPGHWSSGGGIANFGTLTVQGAGVISKNTATVGGGIYNNACGTATVTGNIISENIAATVGGGIYNYGSIILTKSSISGNSATERGGGIGNFGTAIIIDNTINGNNANLWGGGLANWGTATVTGGTISGNRAIYGGGIANFGTATITKNTISGNIGAYGGGIANTNILFVSGTTQILNNQATTGYGGGIYSTKNTMTFDGINVAVKSNKAHLPDMLPAGTPWYKGWGVYLTTGTPTLKNGFTPATQVTGNTHI